MHRGIESLINNRLKTLYFLFSIFRSIPFALDEPVPPLKCIRASSDVSRHIHTGPIYWQNKVRDYDVAFIFVYSNQLNLALNSVGLISCLLLNSLLKDCECSNPRA